MNVSIDLITQFDQYCFIYKQIALVVVCILFSMTTFIIYTQSSQAFRHLIPFLLLLHSSGFAFDFLVLFFDIHPTFPIIALRYREIFAFKPLIGIYYPTMCLFCTLMGVGLEMILRRRMFIVSSFFKISEKITHAWEISVFILAPALNYLPGYFGTVDFPTAKSYYLQKFPDKEYLLPDPQISVYFAPSVNPFIFVQIFSIFFIGIFLSIELSVSVYMFISSIEKQSRISSLKRSIQQRNAYYCVFLQFFSPLVSTAPALMLGCFACLDVPLPYEYFNSFIPILFSLNTYWISFTCIYFNSAYRSYFFRNILRISRNGGANETTFHQTTISVMPTSQFRSTVIGK